MESPDKLEPLLPSTLLDEVEAIATLEDRPPSEIVREAVERYLHDRRPLAAPSRLTPRQAADRILARRPSNILPDGVTIRDLMTHGRA